MQKSSVKGSTIPTTATGDKVIVRQIADGIDHINVHIEARSDLGRKLSLYGKSPFIHPTEGEFVSLAAYWLWCGFDKKTTRHNLKYGLAALEGMRGRYPDVTKYTDDIIFALHLKFSQNPDLYQALMASKGLPIVSYHIFATSLKCCARTIMFLLKEMHEIREGKPLMEKPNAS